jgi:hypothetical protein
VNEGGRVGPAGVVGEAVDRPDAGQAGQRGHHRVGAALGRRQVSGVVARRPDLQRRQQPDDLLLGDLQRPADALERRALAAGGGDQVGPAGQDARPLRPAQPLAAGEGDQVGAQLDEAVEVLRRRQRVRGVDQHRHAAGMGDGDHLVERDARRHAVARPVDAGRLRPEGSLELGARRPARAADLDQPAAGAVDGLGVAPVGVLPPVGRAAAREAHGDELVRHQPVGVRQRRHADRVAAGQDRRRAGQQPGGAARDDVAGLGVGIAADDLAGAVEQLAHVDAAAARVGHRLDHLRPHHRAAVDRPVAGGVDYRPHAEPLVDTHRVPSLSLGEPRPRRPAPAD